MMVAGGQRRTGGETSKERKDRVKEGEVYRERHERGES